MRHLSKKLQPDTPVLQLHKRRQGRQIKHILIAVLKAVFLIFQLISLIEFLTSMSTHQVETSKPFLLPEGKPHLNQPSKGDEKK